ncbi:LysR family transcriptional regulator [Sulfitobacter sp. S45]|uniref:LysR family transcriptional regulator n=1 Tax=Sulfitobacter sp. S45 TaxID=3368581 RepID=UPI003745E2F3
MRRYWRKHLLDLNLIRVFITVYRHLSFTQASRELGTSQPAVSQAIRRLEDQIGTKLFVKEGRGIASTARAVQLAHDLQPALFQIENAVSAQRDIIAYGTEAVLHLIGEVPSVKFLLSRSHQDQALADLRADKVELLIDNTITKDKAFIVEELLMEQMVVICRMDHPSITASEISKEQFLSAEHVVLKTRREGRQFLDLFADELVPSRNDKVEASSLSSVAAMVSRSNYIGVVSNSFAKLWAPQLKLKILPLPFKSRPVPFHMVYHSRYRTDPIHKQIRERIRDKINEITAQSK